MKVLLTNTVLLNGGDAAIMMAVLQHLRQAFGPDAELLVCEAQPEVTRAHYPDVALTESLFRHFLRPAASGRWRIVWGLWRFGWWYLSLPRVYLAAWCYARGLRGLARRLLGRREWEGFATYASADAVVSTGGTYLVEHYWLSPRLFEYRVARILGKPLVFYTQSLGPFTRPALRRRLRRIFRAAALILVRDDRSRDHLLDLGVAGDDIHRLPDVVFALDAPSTPASPGDRLRVAVSVRDWPYFRERGAGEGMAAYRNAVAGAVADLVRRHGAAVTFVSTCQGVPAYTYDDARVAHAIARALPDDVRPSVTVDDAFHRPEDLLAMLASFDLVIATRMHMAILALIAGVPVLPIVYEFKTRELLDRLGYAEWAADAPVLEIERLEADQVTAAVEAVAGRLPEVRAVLAERVRVLRLEADRAVVLLRAAIPTRANR